MRQNDIRYNTKTRKCYGEMADIQTEHIHEIIHCILNYLKITC